MPKEFKYQIVYNALSAKIHSGEYPPGNPLPPERHLATEYDINFHTIRKALALLQKDGVIERRVGSGNYVLGPGAQKVKQSKLALNSGLAVLIQPDSGMYTMNLIDQLHSAAEKKGLFINIRPIKAFDKIAIRAVEQLKRQGCLAVIIPRFETLDASTLFSFVEQSNLPVILPEAVPGLEKNCYYQTDFSGEIDYSMTESAFKYFQKKRYNRIAFFGPDRPKDMPLQRRLISYSRLISRYNFQSYTGIAGDAFSDVDAILKSWFTEKKPLAAICFDDASAMRLMTAAHKNGLKIPEDLAVIGANNSAEGIQADPPLSTIDFPFKTVAKGMINHALALINGKSNQIETIGTGKLIIRQST